MNVAGYLAAFVAVEIVGGVLVGRFCSGTGDGD